MMRKIIPCILVGILIFQSVLIAQVNQKDFYNQKINRFNHMKNSGIGITVGGAILTIVGVGLVIDGAHKETVYEQNYDPYTSDDSTDGAGEALLGVCVVYLGICAEIPGVLLWSIGSAKKHKYMKKLNAVTLNLNPDIHQSLTLTYKF